jgi:hypothetical protein
MSVLADEHFMKDKNGNVIVEVFDNRYDKQVRDVSVNLRTEDFDEVFALTGKSPHLALMEDWEMSSRRWIIFNKNAQAVAVLGIRPSYQFSDDGSPWLLGTEGLNKISKFFLKISNPIIEEMSRGFRTLSNYIDARYVKTVRWMKWLGFTIEEAEPFGELGLPFHNVHMEIT